MSRRTTFALVIAAAACAHAEPLPRDAARDRVPFLEEGTTTAEQVLLELGIPTARFENDRILSYRLVAADGKLRPVARHVPDGDPRLATWNASGMMNLVLVFDERHVLVRYRVIRVR